jgi:hypothetical protein
MRQNQARRLEGHFRTTKARLPTELSGEEGKDNSDARGEKN